MNSTPRIETVEISDADLDNVSGGLEVQPLGTVTDLVSGIPPVSGVTNTVGGALQGVTGTAGNLVAGL